MRDLFGTELTVDEARRIVRRKATPQRGYAAPPGTGPKGETCGTCQHIMRTRRYRKCEKNSARWTGGPGTDILAKAPACRLWESPSSDQG